MCLQQKFPRFLDFILLHFACLFPIIQQLTDRQHRVQGIARLFQRLFRARLTVHQHNDIFHHQARAGQFFDGFEFASACGGEVVNDDDRLARVVFTLDLAFVP